MTRTPYVILDANILLHFQPPDQIDWCALCGSGEILLVIYPLLRTELSNAKDMHPVKGIRRRAGEREAWLREHLRRPTESIRPGVFLHRDVDASRELIEQLSLDRRVKDDMIVALAVRYRSEGRDVRVATADGGLEMKLEDRGISVIVLDDCWRLQPEPDPERLRAEKAERELKTQRDRLPELLVSWQQSGELTRQRDLGDAEAYVRQSLEQAETAYQAMQSDRRRYPTDSIYNPRHAIDLATMKGFLRQQHLWLSRAMGAVRFRMTVRNAGKLAASHVRVRLCPPAGILPYGPGGFGSKPTRGYVNEAFLGIPVHSAGQDIDLDVFGFGNSEGYPHVDRQAPAAEFTWPRIPQLSEVSSVGFWLVATRVAATGPASVRLEIICDEIGGAVSGHLGLVVQHDLAADSCHP